jgi:hypothetical protein
VARRAAAPDDEHALPWSRESMIVFFSSGVMVTESLKVDELKR